jgi:hypothetical protein
MANLNLLLDSESTWVLRQKMTFGKLYEAEMGDRILIIFIQ